MLVAMIAADWLRVVGLHGVAVTAFCLATAAILGLMLMIEPIVEKRRLARQTAQTARKDSRRDDREAGRDTEQR
jgi:hypothetical protein